MILRPTQEEYNEHFHGYVQLVPEGDIEETLARSLNNTLAVLSPLSEVQASFRYAPGKWSIKQVLGHITDNERVMAYRLLRIARGDRTPLASYNQDELVAGANFDACAFGLLLEDYALVRKSTLTLLQGLPAEAWSRSGIVNGNESTVRAWAYIIAGHELHHMKVLEERYLNLIR
ncbi:DinB family protein [Cohnella suwonensis]|uniref:DinB family protein n=1 Tax=Cohnella suwonensis TaxID=696072 RepID=A0ABW0M5M5_9BACL